MGDLGASCANTQNDNTRDLTKQEWDEERFGQLCMTADSFIEIKKTIEKLCASTKKCTYEELQSLNKLMEKLLPAK